MSDAFADVMRPGTRPRWEYFSIEINHDDAIIGKMNEYGQEGWELVAVVSMGTMRARAFFKREVYR